MTGSVASVAVVEQPPLVSFQYPTNPDPCTVSWTLQGSADLLSWVDLGQYSIGCPSGDLTVQATNTIYFYRLKGLTQ